MDGDIVKSCPNCSKPAVGHVIQNDVATWHCGHCNSGQYVVQCPQCGLWLVQGYKDGKPPIVECLTCETYISL